MHSINKNISFTLFIIFLFFPANGSATLYTIEDTWINWPGYTDVTPSRHRTNDDINNPEINKIDVTVEGNFLKRVDIVLDKHKRVLFDSLFINNSWDGMANSWDDWSHFAHDGGDKYARYALGDVPEDGFYSVNDAYEYTYVKSHGRNNNPNGIDAASLFGLDAISIDFYKNVDVSDPNYNKSIISYNFDSLNNGLGLRITDGFFIAYSPFCANDVLGGGFDVAPVPEPATMLLFGTGLAGIATAIRKKKKNT